MGTYRETTLAGKAAQRGIVEQRERQPRSKKSRLVVLECRQITALFGGRVDKDWRKWASYPTLGAAEKSLQTKQRPGFYSKYYEFRIRPTSKGGE